MSDLPALLVTKEAVKRDSALQPGARGARKLLVTEIFAAKERPSSDVVWVPPSKGERCPVQVMRDCEVAVFNQHAVQDRHFHRKGTEIYMVLDGTMLIEVERNEYVLFSGDMIVVNPGVAHQVRPNGTEFLCRVVTLNCDGAQDKYVTDNAV